MQSPVQPGVAGSSGRVDLYVPFADKDAAKKAGDKWDWKKTTWYVPEGASSSVYQSLVDRWGGRPRQQKRQHQDMYLGEYRAHRAEYGPHGETIVLDLGMCRAFNVHILVFAIVHTLGVHHQWQQ